MVEPNKNKPTMNGVGAYFIRVQGQIDEGEINA